MKRSDKIILAAIICVMSVLVAVWTFAGPVTKIQVRRGPEAQLPQKLANGEPGFTTDSHRFFIGYSTGVEEYLKRARFLGYTAATAERLADLWRELDRKALATAPPNPHHQNISTVAGLQTALDNRSTALQSHRTETMQAHGGIGNMLSSHTSSSTMYGGHPYRNMSSYIRKKNDATLNSATVKTAVTIGEAASNTFGNLFLLGGNSASATTITPGQIGIHSSNAGDQYAYFTMTGAFPGIPGIIGDDVYMQWGAYTVKASDLRTHILDITTNPHNITAAKLGLATVATSGSYPDLSNKPVIPVACGTDINTAIFDGKNATFRCSSTTTLAAGSAASVRNDGTPSDGILKFSIPQGATGPQGRPAIFCTLSTSVRAASYDSSGLNPAPALTSIVLQMWNGAVRIVADAYTWWTGGSSQRVYGSGSGTGSNSFTPSLKSVFSNISNNSYVMVQGRYSSATTGKQYCTTGFAYAITRAGIKGDKGEPGTNASVDWASVKAAAGTKIDQYFGLQQNTANQNKLILWDEQNFGRFYVTGDGKFFHVDRNGKLRFVYEQADFTLTLNNSAGNPIFQVRSSHLIRGWNRDGTPGWKFENKAMVIGG